MRAGPAEDPNDWDDPNYFNDPNVLHIDEPDELLRYVTKPDGSWEYYTYVSDTEYTAGAHTGRAKSVISSWGDYAPADIAGITDPNSLLSNAREIVYEYDLNDPNEYRAIRVTEKIKGTAVNLTEYEYTLSDPNDPNSDSVIIERRCLNPTSGEEARNFLETKTTYDADDDDRILKIEFPDDRVDTYVYDDHGDYSDAGDPDDAAFTPDPNEAGDYFRVTITHGTVGSTAGVANKTTREVRVTDLVGRVMLAETYVRTSGSYARIGWTVYRYDPDNPDHLSDIYRSDNTHEEKAWDCCYVTEAVDRHNIVTSYARDEFGRVISRTKEGVGASGSYAAQDDIATSTLYQVVNGERKVTVTVAGSFVTESFYDLAGRIKSQTDPTGLEITYTYGTSTSGDGGGRKITIDRSGGTSTDEITEYYRDGRIKSVSGDGVIHRFHEYDIEDDGDQTTTVYTGSSDNSSDRWVMTTYDPLGRFKLETRPASDPNAPNVVTYNYYDDFGEGQDGTGRLIKTETKVGDNLVQAPTLYEYDEDTGELIRTGLDLNNDGDLDLSGTDRVTESETRFAEISNDWWLETKTYTYLTDNDSTKTLTSRQRQRLTGLGTGVIAETESVDAFDNVTTATTTLDSTDPLVTETTEFPAADNNAVRVTRNGLLQSVTGKAQVTTTFSYDGYGRRTIVIDGRGNEIETHYNNLGQVEWVEDGANNRTTYEYCPANDGGRLKAVKNAKDKYTRYDYNDRGEITYVWGHVPQPVEMAYDDYGQRTTLKTYRDGDDWSDATWPDGQTGDADTTTWTYDPATGLLTEKEYADGKSTTYSYTPEGGLETRTWARDGGITTTYEYDEGSTGTGQIEKIDYPADSDTTDVEFTYTRDGQIKTVTDAAGTRTFTYDGRCQRLYETLDANGIFAGKVIKTDYSYQVGYGDPVGFPPMQPTFEFNGLAEIGVGTSTASPYANYRATYTYDGETDRIEKVTGPGLPNKGANYSYVADSHLIDKIEFKQNATIQATIDREYEQHRDLLTSIENKWDATGVSKYGYENDELGRRKWVVREGSAFAAAHHDTWGYNDRNELTGSERFAGTDPANPDTADDALDRFYQYDPIGNREWYKEGTDPNTVYTANNLNQYTATTTPSESFTYDDDGNLTEDGDFEYTWDAENRLIAIEPKNPDDDSKKVKFAYDYMGRRVRKEVFDWDPSLNGGAGGWETTAETDLLFVYYNWLLLLELDALDDNAVIRKYAWGLDLSGTLEGAGGIGGLLGQRDPVNSKRFIYFHDANGNVGQMIDRSDGSLAARYEYDAYGDTLVSAGNFADTNPFRFSTKYWDDETDLGYWGYRYYSPRLGRWINRDPLGQPGGSNLYVFLLNDPALGIDSLGLQTTVKTEQFCCQVHLQDTGLDYRYQKTIECQCKSSPKVCCECGKAQLAPFRHQRPEFRIADAHSGKCCSCRVQARRMRPKGKWRYVSWILREWPQHISVLVKCSDGRRYKMEHYKSGGKKISEPGDAGDDAWIGTGNTKVVWDKCVSCDSVGYMIAKAKELEGCHYNGLQDCHWLARQLQEELERHIVYSKDACPSIPKGRNWRDPVP